MKNETAYHIATLAFMITGILFTLAALALFMSQALPLTILAIAAAIYALRIYNYIEYVDDAIVLSKFSRVLRFRSIKHLEFEVLRGAILAIIVDGKRFTLKLKPKHLDTVIALIDTLADPEDRDTLRERATWIAWNA